MINWEVPPSRRMAFVGVLVVVAVAMVTTVLMSFRAGGYLLALALGLAAVLRACLPPMYCLGLIVRSRQVDVAIAGVLAVAVAVLARSVPG